LVLAGDPPILIARAPSRTVSPTLPARVVERAYERDPMAARAEYDAEFRTDVAAFLDLACESASGADPTPVYHFNVLSRRSALRPRAE
jgi:hypothetical protein